MKKILSFAYSFYQFWIIIILVSIGLVVLPKTIREFKDGYPAKIKNVEKISEPLMHKPFLYNKQKTAKIEETPNYTVEFITGKGNIYNFVYKILEIALLIFVFFSLFKIFSSIRHDDPFTTKMDTWLNRIGLALFITWLFSIAYDSVMTFQIHNAGFENYKLDQKDGSYFLFALLAFAFARIFKKGKQYKEETDLTV